MKLFYSYIPLKGIDSEYTFFDAICIKYSSTILRNLGYKVGIYSNNEFIELLKSYSIELDFYEDIGNEIKEFIDDDIFFAISKIYTNSIQTEPFIQLDYDTIFFKDFQFEKFNSKFLFGFRERVDDGSSIRDVIVWKENYLNFFLFLNDTYGNDFIQNSRPLLAYNCNVVGGTEWKTISDGYSEIYQFMKKNKKIIKNFPYSPSPGTIMEQQMIVGSLVSRGVDLHLDVKFCSNENMLSFWENNGFAKVIVRDREYQFYSEDITKAAPREMQELIDYDFEGYLHLLGARNLDVFKNMVYTKLKKLEPHFIVNLEKLIGKRYTFQKNIYQSLL
jgi:hypothetical protein